MHKIKTGVDDTDHEKEKKEQNKWAVYDSGGHNAVCETEIVTTSVCTFTVSCSMCIACSPKARLLKIPW